MIQNQSSSSTLRGHHMRIFLPDKNGSNMTLTSFSIFNNSKYNQKYHNQSSSREIESMFIASSKKEGRVKVESTMEDLSGSEKNTLSRVTRWSTPWTTNKRTLIYTKNLKLYELQIYFIRTSFWAFQALSLQLAHLSIVSGLYEAYL